MKTGMSERVREVDRKRGGYAWGEPRVCNKEEPRFAVETNIPNDTGATSNGGIVNF